MGIYNNCVSQKSQGNSRIAYKKCVSQRDTNIKGTALKTYLNSQSFNILSIGPGGDWKCFMSIAKLHKAELKAGLLAELHTSHLARFYHFMACNPELAALVICVDKKNNLCGFISVSLDTRSLYIKFAKRHWFLLLMVLLSLTAKPKLYKRLFSFAKYLRQNPKIHKINAEILSIAVSASKKRQGLGNTLFESAKTYFLNHSISTFTVMAAYTQTSAHHFYQKMGGICIGNVELGLLNTSIYQFDYSKHFCINESQ